MKKTEIIETLKAHYDRETRKQLVKSILQNEKQEDETDYKIINQIFSYVLKELDWNFAKNTKEWDNTPLDIMEDVFPQIESTKWYKEQILTAKKMIDVQIGS
ncbi:MAG: hypothetical protein OQK45_03530 [Sulfurovum sp.]|nr:hypothetical protein [Sulfurovum sp.]